MSWQSEKEEGAAFSSLSAQEQTRYFESLRNNGGRVRVAMDDVLGETWFNRDGTPKGHRHLGKNDGE